MKEEERNFENELRRLVPRELSEAARLRIRAAMRDTAGNDRTAEQAGLFRDTGRRWMVGLGIAAALMLGAGGLWLLSRRRALGRDETVVLDRPRAPEQAEDRYDLVSVDTYLVNEQDEGTVMKDGEAPARQLRYDCVDRMRWHNPKKEQTYTVTRPRQEVRLVSFETY